MICDRIPPACVNLRQLASADLFAPIGELVADLLSFGDRVLELDLAPQAADFDLVDVFVVHVETHLLSFGSYFISDTKKKLNKISRKVKSPFVE